MHVGSPARVQVQEGISLTLSQSPSSCVCLPCVSQRSAAGPGGLACFSSASNCTSRTDPIQGGFARGAVFGSTGEVFGGWQSVRELEGSTGLV